MASAKASPGWPYILENSFLVFQSSKDNEDSGIPKHFMANSSNKMSLYYLRSAHKCATSVKTECPILAPVSAKILLSRSPAHLEHQSSSMCSYPPRTPRVAESSVPIRLYICLGLLAPAQMVAGTREKLPDCEMVP